MYTKAELIQDAFEELGIAAYVFDLTAEQRASALRVLDRMMAQWCSTMDLGYNFPVSPAISALSDSSGLADKANDAVIANLAVRLGPRYGKTPSIETKAAATRLLNDLRVSYRKDYNISLLSTMPVGAGNKTVAGLSSRYFSETDPADS